jgi:hypothetical protein
VRPFFTHPCALLLTLLAMCLAVMSMPSWNVLGAAWQAADPPVRANVLHLDPEFATVISWVRWALTEFLAILFLNSEMKLFFLLCKREDIKFSS